MMAHGHWCVDARPTIWRKLCEVAFKAWNPWSSLLVRSSNCCAWIMLLVSMVGRSCWSSRRIVWLKEHLLISMDSCSWRDTAPLLTLHMTCIKAIHHSTRWPISPPVTSREDFFSVCSYHCVFICVPVSARVCICEHVCNEGWFSTPGEARDVWGWPSLAVGEKYHLLGDEVIGCLRLSFWLIVGSNS